MPALPRVRTERSARWPSAKTAADLHRLLDVTAAIDASLPVKPLLKLYARKTADACRVERCTIFLWRGTRLVRMTSQLATGGPRRAERAGSGAVVEERSRGPVIVEPDGMWSAGSVAVLPLVQRRRPIGAIELDNDVTSARITPEQLRIARAAGQALALALSNARLVGDLRRRLDETESLLRVGQIVGSSLHLPEVIRRVTREAARNLGADSAGIYSEERRLLQPLAGYHIPKRFLEGMQTSLVPLEEFPALREGLERSCSIWSDDVPSDARFQHPIMARFPMQSVIMTRLEAQHERVGMLVCAWWTRRRQPTPGELRLVEGIARQAAMAIVNARLYADAAAAAVSREHSRLDRMIHDTVNQTLFSVVLRIERCLRLGPAHLRAILEEIRSDTSLVMTQVRQLIADSSLDAPAGRGPA